MLVLGLVLDVVLVGCELPLQCHASLNTYLGIHGILLDFRSALTIGYRGDTEDREKTKQ